MALDTQGSSELQKDRVVAGLDDFNAKLRLAAERIPKRYRLENSDGSHNSRLMIDKIELIEGVLKHGKRRIEAIWDIDRSGALREVSRLNNVIFEILEGFYVGVRKYYEHGKALIPPKYVDYAYCDLFNGFMNGVQPILKDAASCFIDSGMDIVEGRLGNLQQRHKEARERLGLPAAISDYERRLVHAEDAGVSDIRAVKPNCEDVGGSGIRIVEDDEVLIEGEDSVDGSVPEGYMDKPVNERVTLYVNSGERVKFIESALGMLHDVAEFVRVTAGRDMQQAWWRYIADSVTFSLDVIKVNSPALLVGLHEVLSEFDKLDNAISGSSCCAFADASRMRSCIYAVYEGVYKNCSGAGYDDSNCDSPLKCFAGAHRSLLDAFAGAANMIAVSPFNEIRKGLVPDVPGDKEVEMSGEIPVDNGVARLFVADSGIPEKVIPIFDGASCSREFVMPIEKPKKGLRRFAMAVTGIAALCVAVLLPNKSHDADPPIVPTVVAKTPEKIVADVGEDEVRHYGTVWDAAEDVVGKDDVRAVIEKTHKMLAANDDILEGSLERMENNSRMYRQLRDMVASYGGWVPPSDITTFHQLYEVERTGVFSTIEVDTFLAEAAAGALTQKEIDLIVDRTESRG